MLRASTVRREGGSVSPIGQLNEGHVHASLKALYRRPDDIVEAEVDGYVVDILRDDGVLEIQTSSFSHIGAKLRDLVERHRVRLVHPIARERYLVRLPATRHERPRRRRSPRRYGFEQVFEELVSIPDLVAHENFELEIVAIREEEVSKLRSRRRRRGRQWVVVERRFLDALESFLVTCPGDLLRLLPEDLPEPFDTRELADRMGQPRWLAQRAAYCLRESGAVRVVGKQGNTLQYASAG